jgi:magnesium-transporting ATPase (P-type)
MHSLYKEQKRRKKPNEMQAKKQHDECWNIVHGNIADKRIFAFIALVLYSCCFVFRLSRYTNISLSSVPVHIFESNIFNDFYTVLLRFSLCTVNCNNEMKQKIQKCLSNLSTLCVPDEGYSRTVSLVRNYICFIIVMHSLYKEQKRKKKPNEMQTKKHWKTERRLERHFWIFCFISLLQLTVH